MSVIINTKKELFLGKRPFKATKMDKEEFCQRIEQLYNQLKSEHEDMDYEDYGYDCDDITRAKLLAITDTYDTDVLDSYYNDCDEMIGAGTAAMNWEDFPGQFEIHSLNNGFTYMGVYSSVGDDAYLPVYNIIYFDDDGKLRVFVPYCGNLVFVGAGVSMGSLYDYDEGITETKRLFEEAGKDYDSDYELFFDIYGEKYGIEGGQIKMTEDYAMEDLGFDVTLMTEDISSNIILV